MKFTVPPDRGIFPGSSPLALPLPLLFFLVNGMSTVTSWKPGSLQFLWPEESVLLSWEKSWTCVKTGRCTAVCIKFFVGGVCPQRKIQSRKISREWCMMYSYVFRMITRWDWWIYGSQFGKTHLWWWVAADQRMSAPSWKAAWHQFQGSRTSPDFKVQMTSRPEIGVYTLIVEKIYIIYSCVRVWIGKKKES